ncbi:Pyrrolidone-carboxylate peptidase [Bremerella volcania]|uniref:Pyrrolidone-carboxylate peptidase n=1 Tax=Bremerella volcania TaxID=2527984 RepID=A0A518CED3_9BACT|nr:pyroglutamyl-peptidase I [Bremerella volcania]QDU77577.1 Pyrrolidone-carboxylate peptidase [Bremerella volcania]
MMHRILITAFEPFLQYPTNASMQILTHWAEDNPGSDRIAFTTEILPVDYNLAEPRLGDLHADWFDFALHLGQSPRIDEYQLEMVALNLKSDPKTPTSPLSPFGPTAFASQLPLDTWCQDLREHDLPASVSFHAGTYLCNATYYWSMEIYRQRGLSDRSLFVHVPLIDMDQPNPEHAIRRGSRMLARLVRLIEGHLDVTQAPFA